MTSWDSGDGRRIVNTRLVGSLRARGIFFGDLGVRSPRKRLTVRHLALRPRPRLSVWRWCATKGWAVVMWDSRRPTGDAPVLRAGIPGPHEAASGCRRPRQGHPRPMPVARASRVPVVRSTPDVWTSAAPFSFRRLGQVPVPRGPSPRCPSRETPSCRPSGRGGRRVVPPRARAGSSSRRCVVLGTGLRGESFSGCCWASLGAAAHRLPVRARNIAGPLRFSQRVSCSHVRDGCRMLDQLDLVSVGAGVCVFG
jgi:hypothetical protein